MADDPVSTYRSAWMFEEWPDGTLRRQQQILDTAWTRFLVAFGIGRLRHALTDDALRPWVHKAKVWIGRKLIRAGFKLVGADIELVTAVIDGEEVWL